MLRPNKYSHPDETVLAAATTLLKELRRSRAVPYDDLKAKLDKRGEERGLPVHARSEFPVPAWAGRVPPDRRLV